MDTGRKLSWLEKQDLLIMDRMVTGTWSKHDRKVSSEWTGSWWDHICTLGLERRGWTTVSVVTHQ